MTLYDNILRMRRANPLHLICLKGISSKTCPPSILFGGDVWQGQMMVLPASSRCLLRVAATLYTSLEGDVPTTLDPTPTRKAKATSESSEKVDRIMAIFKSALVKMIS